MTRAAQPVNRHAHCAAGFYSIGPSGDVRCGLCGETADVITGHAMVISAAVTRPVLRAVK